MKIKKISYSQLKEAIRVAFDGDSEIFNLYDPNVSVSSIDELVNDVYWKISEYNDVDLFAVYEKEILIGYFVTSKKQLISFGLSVNYRLGKYVNNFYWMIKKKLGDDFFVLLWKKNVRAMRWLIKNGMAITFSQNQIIKLQCQ